MMRIDGRLLALLGALAALAGCAGGDNPAPVAGSATLAPATPASALRFTESPTAVPDAQSAESMRPSPTPPATPAPEAVIPPSPTTTAAPPPVPEVAPRTASPVPTPAGIPETPAPPPPARSVAEVRPTVIRDLSFEPVIEVATGSTVVWTNVDGIAHTVTSADATLDSPFLTTGSTYYATFPRAGTFNYFCRPHLQMTATVIVRE
jgi:plastocyanin